MISPSPSNVSDSSADPTENNNGNGNSSALSFKTKVGFVLGFAVGFVFMQAMVFLGVRSGFRDLGLEGDPSTTQAKQQRLGGAGQQHRLEELDSGTISGSGSIHDAVNHTTTTNSLHEATTTKTTTEGRSFHVKASLKRDKEEESTPSQLQPTAPSDTDTIFQLPFYIYDNELDWSVNNSLGDNTGYYGYKHSDDYWLLQSAKKHPMRTYNPKEAELFFVPILLTAWNAYGYKGNDHPNKFCVNGRCNVDLLLYSDQLLGRSKWFRRSQGRDHILVDTHWRKVHWKELSNKQQSQTRNLLHCNTVSFERRHVSPEVLPGFVTPTGGRAHVPTMYVGRPCQNFANKTHDFAMIANMQPQNPNFHDRSRICKYLGESSPYLGGDDVKYSVAHCGKGGQCPALGRSRFGFHARGDTWGSNRLMDTFLSGAIPLVTNREQYKILPDFVPWADVTYLVDVSQSSRFHKSMKRVLEAPEKEYLEKKANITKFMDVFDHKQGRQFDLYMHKFAQLLELYE